MSGLIVNDPAAAAALIFQDLGLHARVLDKLEAAESGSVCSETVRVVIVDPSSQVAVCLRRPAKGPGTVERYVGAVKTRDLYQPTLF